MRKNTTLKGLKDVLKTIQKISAKSEKVTPKQKEKAALEIEREAVFLVRVKHGRLKGSIQVVKNGDNYEVSAGGMEVDGKEIDYAGYIEFGTKNSRAYPFMRPAAAAVQEKYPDLIISGIAQAIKQAGVH